jgi:hypothetical protein
MFHVKHRGKLLASNILYIKFDASSRSVNGSKGATLWIALSASPPRNDASVWQRLGIDNPSINKTWPIGGMEMHKKSPQSPLNGIFLKSAPLFPNTEFAEDDIEHVLDIDPAGNSAECLSRKS